MYWLGHVRQTSSLKGTSHPASHLALKLVYELLEAVDLQLPL